MARVSLGTLGWKRIFFNRKLAGIGDATDLIHTKAAFGDDLAEQCVRLSLKSVADYSLEHSGNKAR